MEIVKDNHNYYSQAGKSSLEKITYLLDRKSQIDKILEGKQRTSIIKDNNISLEENQEIIDIQDESDNEKNIFSEKYKNKHNLDIQEQKLKYFAGVKNPCTYIEKRVKKNITERRKAMKKEKKEKNIDDENYEMKENSPEKKEDLPKTIAKEELYKIINSGNNFNYYYHLLHHTDNANYYSENAKNIIIFGPEVNATRYNPKLEYIYPKTIYSPSFKSMSGRYDKEELTEKVKQKLEKKMLERDNNKKINKSKEKIDKMKIQYKSPQSYQEKKERNKQIMYKKYIDEKTNSSNTNKGNKSEMNNINFNELISKEYNSSNSKNNKSGTNNNETIFTSHIIKNANYNESNINNSNINNNIILNNAFLTIRLSNYLNALKNNNKNIRKINLINKSKYPDINPKTTYASSTSNIFKSDKNKTIRLNRTSSDNNIFTTKTIDSIQNRMKLDKEKEKENLLYTIRAPNFNKMLSRDYLNKLNYQEEPIHPQLNPNFNVVQPKCVMKVIYSHRPTQKKTINILKGLGDEFTFDINKLYHKYNNHSPAKSFYFNKMKGRAGKNKENNLPFYMLNLANRYSCMNFNEKSYLMNNFYEGRLKSPISSFNQQKSFNNRLIDQKKNDNLNEEKNNDKDAFKIFTKILENISTKNKRKKFIIPQQDYMSVTYKNGFLNGLPEFYRINLDSIKRKNKIDGITYKMYRSSSEGKDLLSKKDKEVFLVNLNENK